MRSAAVLLLLASTVATLPVAYYPVQKTRLGDTQAVIENEAEVYDLHNHREIDESWPHLADVNTKGEMKVVENTEPKALTEKEPELGRIPETKSPVTTKKEDKKTTIPNKEDRKTAVSNKEDKKTTIPNKKTTIPNKENKKTAVSNKEDKNTTIPNKKTAVSNKEDKKTAVSNKEDKKTTISKKEDKKTTVSNKEDKKTKKSTKEDVKTAKKNDKPAEKKKGNVKATNTTQSEVVTKSGESPSVWTSITSFFFPPKTNVTEPLTPSTDEADDSTTDQEEAPKETPPVKAKDENEIPAENKGIFANIFSFFSGKATQKISNTTDDTEGKKDTLVNETESDEEDVAQVDGDDDAN